jgi:phenylalanyl-tRNA synthetase alpha chain
LREIAQTRKRLRTSTTSGDMTTGDMATTDLDTLERDLLAQVESASDEAALEAVRVAALGKKGSVSDLLKTLGAMTPDERKTRGPQINGLRDRVQGALAGRREALAEAALEARLAAERIDVTLPLREAPEARGRIHPISQVVDEITAIFADMGFAVAEGPDIETDELNFTALNFPPGHPAREMHDTFFLAPDAQGKRKVLRTHTSPVQIRTMRTKAPPIRVIIPGRTYRHDSDQTHTPMFHQCEGLVIDSAANIANLKWVLEEFCRAFFEVDAVKMRFRPSRAARSASARARIGWRSSAAAWSTPTCCAIAASILTRSRASPSASVSTESPCSNTACRTCAPSSRRMCAGSTITASARSTCRAWSPA